MPRLGAAHHAPIGHSAAPHRGAHRTGHCRAFISMGKKTAAEAPRSRRQKSKFKEMFPELATHREQIVQREEAPRRQHSKRVIADSEEEVELEVLEHHNNDLDTICETVHRLLSKNKVTAKNAFDVPLIDLEQLPDFTGSMENEYAWKKLSSTLENDYKIYAYRVDAIHSITYNILHTMSRRQQDIDALQPAPPPDNPTEHHPAQPLRITEGAESEHLQRRVQNLNLTEFELALGVDPILERNKRKFDQLGVENMLMNSLAIDDFLGLELVKSGAEPRKYPPWGEHNDIWTSPDPLMAFIELADFRARTAEAIDGKMRDEEVYELLFDEKENHFYENYPHNLGEVEFKSSKKKEIGKEVRLKHRQLPIETDMVDEASHLDDHLFRKHTAPLVRTEPREENPEDLVNFELSEEDTRTSVFLPEKDKNEFKEELEDKFLVAVRLANKFELEKYPLTLKENPRIVVSSAVNAEVDVRRQQISISDAKRKMKDLIHARSTFKTLYSGYRHYDDISPALCFLTLLHLANENGFGFEQIDDHNFYIR